MWGSAVFDAWHILRPNGNSTLWLVAILYFALLIFLHCTTNSIFLWNHWRRQWNLVDIINFGPSCPSKDAWFYLLSFYFVSDIWYLVSDSRIVFYIHPSVHVIISMNINITIHLFLTISQVYYHDFTMIIVFNFFILINQIHML